MKVGFLIEKDKCAYDLHLRIIYTYILPIHTRLGNVPVAFSRTPYKCENVKLLKYEVEIWNGAMRLSGILIIYTNSDYSFYHFICNV